MIGQTTEITVNENRIQVEIVASWSKVAWCAVDADGNTYLVPKSNVVLGQWYSAPGDFKYRVRSMATNPEKHCAPGYWGEQSYRGKVIATFHSYDTPDKCQRALLIDIMRKIELLNRIGEF